MLSTQVVNRILDKRTDLIFVDGYFFLVPFGDIAVGIACDVRPHGATITNFYYPLFDWEEFIHVGFSKPVATGCGFIDFQKSSRSQLADEILIRAGGIERETVSIEGFVAFAEASPGILKNPRLELTYGTALVLLGDTSRATTHIAHALHSRTGTSDSTFSDRCRSLLSLLDQSLSAAQARIRQRINETRSRFFESIDFHKRKIAD